MKARRERKHLFNSLIARIGEIARAPSSRDEKLLAVSRLLAESVPHFNWVGFYLADAQGKAEFILGPYVGEPTGHIRIPFGRGVCGRVALTGKTLVVQDVSKESDYLACSARVKSEIAAPILKDGKVVGQIDVDSHTLSPFTDDDRTLLEETCEILSTLF